MLKKSLKPLLALILTLILGLAAAAPALADSVQVPVKNSDFSQWNDKTGLPKYFDKFVWKDRNDISIFGFDTDVKYEGDSSIYIDSRFSNDARIKTDIKVQPQQYYRITVMVKTEGIGNQSLGANISILGTGVVSNDMRGTTRGWTLLQLYGKTAPGQRSMTLTLGVGGHSNLNYGKAWFDDLNVEKIDEAAIPPGIDPEDLSSQQTSPQKWLSTAANGIMFWFALLIAIIVLAMMFLFFKLNILNLRGKLVGRDNPELLDEPVRFVRFYKKDFVIMLIMTAIYLAVAFYKLGSTEVPKTYWEPVRMGESITFDLGREVELSQINFYVGLGDGTFKIQAADNKGNFKEIKSVTFDEFEACYNWNSRTLGDVKTSKVRLTFDNFNAMLNEVAFYEKDSMTPLTGVRISSSVTEFADSGKPENLIDEQQYVEYLPSYMTGMYFDEIYHARTAYETLNKINPYETTHPPLGKVIMSFGVWLFGMNPFGWRIMGMLFGAAMIPLMYAFGKKIFRSRFGGFAAAFLMMFDFMHFTQTRIALIDAYAVFFIIAMYYFMYDYFIYRTYGLGYGKSLRVLFYTGLFFGLGAAAKWISIYAAVGLALLFFFTKYGEYRKFMSVMRPSKRKGKKVKLQEESLISSGDTLHSTTDVAFTADEAVKVVQPAYTEPVRQNPDIPFFDDLDDYVKPEEEEKQEFLKPKYVWMRHFVDKYFNKTLLYVILFFIVIPAIIYVLSYIPYMMVDGNSLKSVWENQLYMYKYHSSDVLSATHDFASSWWSWPLMIRPMWFYDGKLLDDTLKSTIVTMGNPAIWWFGVVTFFWAGVISIRKRDLRMVPIYVGIICQYVPWIFVKRVVFIYHYFSVVPFLILTIVYILADKWDSERNRNLKRGFIIAYLVLVAGLFVMFYPAISGVLTSKWYVVNILRWLPSWYF